MAGLQQMADAATHSKHAIDYAIGTGGATSPVWYPWLNQLNEIAASVAMLGGVVLVGLRIWIAIRELKK